MNTTSVNIFNNPVALNGPRKYVELVHNIPENVHQKLYNDALNDLINDLSNYEGLEPINPQPGDELNPSSWKNLIVSTTEIPYTEYWTPSNVKIVFRWRFNDSNEGIVRTIYRAFTFDLAPYWKSPYNKNGSTVHNVQYDSEMSNDREIIKYDYIRGKAIVYSRTDDVQYEVDLDEVGMNDKVSAECKIPDDLFIRQINLIDS